MFFRKPKGWKDLSEADRKWVRSLSPEDGPDALLTCVRDNDPVCARFLVENGTRYMVTDRAFAAALAEALRRKNLRAVKAMMDADNTASFMPDDWRQRDRYILSYYEAAAASKNMAAWRMLEAWVTYHDFKANRPQEARLTSVIVSAGFEEMILHRLEHAGTGRARVLDDAIAAASGNPALMDMVLAHAGHLPETKKVLDAALSRAAAEGLTADIDKLIAAGANLNHTSCDPLLKAALNGRFEAVDHLLAKPALDLAAYGHLVVARLREKAPQTGAAEYVQERYAALREKQERAQLQQERFTLAAPDTLAEAVPLPTGGVLTMLFNFATRQQIIMVREKGAEPSVRIVNFADVESASAIDNAAKKLIELGGDAKVVAAYRRDNKQPPPRN